ncbi:MAG: hypothetical protein ABI681_09060 [Gemmatimonadales bacterium]
MPSLRSRFTVVAVALTVAANAHSASAQTSTNRGKLAPDGVTPGVASMSTASASAKAAFAEGLRASDVERGPAARAAFLRAVGADPNFALAHLYAARTANSLPEYRAHLDHATQYSAGASEAEKLMIQMERRGFDGDVEGQLQLAEQLVKVAPSNPRAWIQLAGIQSGLGREADARRTLSKAITLSPNFAAAHVLLGNSYLQIEPRDLTQAEKHVKQAVALEPNEPFTHDYLGDTYRAQNKLEKARAEYTRMTVLNPKLAGAYQQRGHVNSFLGNYAQAGADYDKSMMLGQDNEKPNYAVYKALVAVHAGDPAAAERELGQLVDAIDGMNVPDPTQAKIFALETQAEIAMNRGHMDVAQTAIDKLRPLYAKQAAQAGTPEFKAFADAAMAYDDGLLAARKGDYATASAKAAEYMRLRSAEKNSRKDEQAHALLGMTALLQKDYAGAAAHFEHANPNDIYIAYYHALALEGAGRKAEARVLFKRVAETNFNGSGLALVKKDAARRMK